MDSKLTFSENHSFGMHKINRPDKGTKGFDICGINYWMDNMYKSN